MSVWCPEYFKNELTRKRKTSEYIIRTPAYWCTVTTGICTHPWTDTSLLWVCCWIPHAPEPAWGLNREGWGFFPSSRSLKPIPRYSPSINYPTLKHRFCNLAISSPSPIPFKPFSSLPSLFVPSLYRSHCGSPSPSLLWVLWDSSWTASRMLWWESKELKLSKGLA